MEVHGECAEPTALGEQPPPSGKLNKTAFKLFKRRRSGGAMPSIFGVRSGGSKSKSGEGGGGPASSSSSSGMVRSKTHDGLAEAALESGKKDGPAGGRGTGDEPPQQGAPSPGSPSSSSSSGAANAAAAAVVVGKAPRFFSLLRKNGRPGEGGPGERPKGRGGLKGLFSSMRWPRRDNHKPGSGGPGGGGEAKEEGGGGESPPSRLLQPGSLTASLECIKEEAPPPLPRPPPSAAEAPLPSPPGSPSAGDPLVAPQKESPTFPEKPPAEGQERPPATPGAALPAEYLPKVQLQGKESRPELAQDAEGQKSQEDNTAITGCGDIIADQEEDMGGSGSGSSGAGGRDKTAPGLNKAGASKKPPSVVAYQGGGEEMASPEQVEDTCTPEFWDTLSQTEEKAQEAPGAKESPKASKDGSLAKREQNGTTTGQHASVSQFAAHHNHKEDPKIREKEQQEAVPSSDEGYWDSTTPGPEEDNTNSIQKEVIPRDSYSGDALYDLYAEPEENTTTVTSAEDVISVTCCKPVSPVTTTCPVKTHTTSLKDSKIPISIKHFTSPHGSHGPDASNSHHIIHHQPTKSEVPRTKIPVSKVLVHRASYRSLAGTTGKIATYHESAKK